MTEGQKSIWFGAAFVVVIALAGVTLWRVTRPNDEVAKQLAAINDKIDATDAALAKVQKATSPVEINDKLGQLAAKLEKTNAALAELQKGALLKSVADKLDALNAGIKDTDTALADITKSIPHGGLDAKIGDKIDAIGNDLKSVDSTLAEIKQIVPSQKLSAQLTAVSGEIKSLNESVADLQKASAGAAADKTAALSGAVGELQKNIDAASSLGGKLAEQAAKLQDAAKAAAQPKPSDLVVVYLHMPEESKMPQPIATVSPLSVEFAKIGGTDDKGQANVIVAKLKQVVKGRKDCTVSVAGYADTLGGDDLNLEISKKRAAEIATKLSTAFAGTDVKIVQAAWGERRLKDWTPDQTARKANRRVDVAVNCKG
jgi:outer membrane protein OmpA-like peptidoglycan-associated protein